MQHGQDSEDFRQSPVHDDITALQARVDQLQLEAETANSRAVRALADFQNYQRRATLNEQAARVSGASSVAMSVIQALDTFDIALRATDANASAEQVLRGVRVIQEELLRALEKHGVVQITPMPNDEFLPGVHEAVMQQAREGVSPGHIVDTFQPGFILRGAEGERVLRAAKVIVAPKE
jgi:molecular chaperone GrpE